MSFIIVARVREESQNDKRLKLIREREAIGRELVTVAANGDVDHCRLILQKVKLIEAKKTHLDLPEEPRTHSFGVIPRLATSSGCEQQPTEEEMILTNFMSSGHTSLQAAAQNGHINMCKVLISEFGADVEFQVQN